MNLTWLQSRPCAGTAGGGGSGRGGAATPSLPPAPGPALAGGGSHMQSLPAPCTNPSSTAATRKRFLKRGAIRAAAAPSSPPPPPPPPELTDDERAAVRAAVEAAAKTLDDIVEEVSREVFVAEAAAYVYNESPDVALADAVRGAVARRLEWLDGNFLAAVGAYADAAARQGNAPLAKLLGVLRDEVLAQVTLRMPAPVRVLDAALKHDRMSERLRVLRTALAGGAGDVPAADMQSLAATANQFVDDMEEQQVVADRALLARLVLIREELRALHQRAAEQRAGAEFTGAGGGGTSGASGSGAGSGAEAAAAAGSGGRRRRRPLEERRGGVLEEAPGAPPPGAESSDDADDPNGAGAAADADSLEAIVASSAAAVADAAADDGGFFSFHRGNVPRRCAAFVRALLGVEAPARRLALLRKAFYEEWDGAGPSRPPAAAAAASSTSPDGGGGGGEPPEAPDVVRPGRLLASIHAMRRELQVQYGSSDLSASGAAGAAKKGRNSGKAAQQQQQGSGSDREPSVAEALGGVGPILARLNQIQIEAALVLDEMQRGGGGGGGGSGGGSGGDGKKGREGGGGE